MVNVVSKMCNHPGCYKQPSFNFPDTKPAIKCVGHKEEGMVNVSWRNKPRGNGHSLDFSNTRHSHISAMSQLCMA